MIEENDSFEEDPIVTREEMIEAGRNIGAAYALICSDSDPQVPLQVVYVMIKDDVDRLEKHCWRSSYYVETVDLND